MSDDETTPARLRKGALELALQAAGTPEQMRGKLLRLLSTLARYADAEALDARMKRLRALGLIEEIPSRVQLVIGSIDMLRFWISPAAAEYYQSKGISYGFHQVLRILDEPASMVDPTGFLSSRDNIIGHLMQVVHANPAYDLQLLCSYERGLEELEEQVEQMLAGTHPRHRSISAVVEEPDYHARLLTYVQAFRASPDAKAPLRQNVLENPELAPLERTFGTLPAAMRYFTKMPTTWAGGLIHLRKVQRFPLELAEPESEPSTRDAN
jgi:hypothetical protein